MKKEEIFVRIKIPFLILGFTGPVGSGCTTLADIIARTSPSALVKRKRFYEETVKELENISKEMKKTSNNEELQKFNKRLETCYEKRACFTIIQQIKDPKFIYISMSALIIKLVIETMNGPDFIAWSQRFPEMAKMLNGFKLRWIDTINLYNLYEKNYEELSSKDLNTIDEMFKAFIEIRKKITDVELEDYFNNKIDELHFQNFGDNLRKTGNAFITDSNLRDYKNLPIIAKEVNRYIKYCRNRTDGKNADCFVIDAFRNPAEVEFFRRYDQFFLISLYASEKTRRERLEKAFCGDTLHGNYNFIQKFREIDKRDWGNDSNINELDKQNVSRCYYMADISFNNDDEVLEFDLELFKKFIRYYALIVSPGCIQPTKEETFMNLAYSLSLRSSCISRKVGAVITDKAGFVLGLGWNEVAHGQIGCGLRLKEDFLSNTELFSMNIFREIFSEDDFVQYTTSDSICFKDVLSEKKIREKLSRTKLSGSDKNAALQVLNIKRLEYCRSLHAEENALLQVASRGGMGVNEGEIYTTTFPCELCAKKIYQSGIKRIYFTEPYPNSISENVF